MVKGQSSDKTRYRVFCKENSLWLFIQPWWLDAVSDSRWNVILDIRGGRIMGGWVYCQARKFGISYLTNSPLSPYQGYFFNYPEDLSAKRRLSFEEEVVRNLSERLPSKWYINQKLHPSHKNLLPLHWLGYTVNMRFTYVLNEINDLSVVWNNFYPSTRKAIRKAEKRFNLEVIESQNPKIAYDFHVGSMSRKKESPQFSLNLLQRLDTELKSRNLRKIFLAKDLNGNIHGAVYIVWHENTAYYLLGGSAPHLRQSGVSKFLLWEAIKSMSGMVNYFDFEGSMIPSVERIFRSFGAKQQQYSQLIKYRFPLNVLKIWH